MSVSIAIRLAMLKQITNVDIYFMDEPTINLDYERRIMVSEVVKDISNELNQLFVISHDDTFEAITDDALHPAISENKGSAYVIVAFSAPVLKFIPEHPGIKLIDQHIIIITETQIKFRRQQKAAVA